MAGGKETPRQKMIGLMYLVLTAMLALNVSKAILKGYLSINDSIEESKRNMALNNKRVTDAFKNSVLLNKGAEPYYNQALASQKEIDVMFKYVDELKGNFMRVVAGLPDGVKVLGDTINLRHEPWNPIIDNYDVPTQVLIGVDEHNPNTGPLSAAELRDKLTKLHDKLIAQLDNMQKNPKEKLLKDDYDNLKKKIEILKPVPSGFVEDGITFTWEMDQVDHLPMAAVFVNMNKIQADLRNVEAEILQVFSAASGKLTIKFDQLKARVIAKSSYVQAGQPYEADVFIGASSSKISSGDMEIYLGIDSTAAASGQTGQKVEIVSGEGKLKIPTGGEGDQKYKGVIKYKNPDGSFKYYPFEEEYKVAKPAGSVAADFMNVFYAGVANPVTASAAGISPLDVEISPSGSGVKSTKKGPGKYELFFANPGECLITVNGKTKDGMKAQGPPVKFKVKPLPKPEAKIGGKFAPSEMKKGELATVAAVGAGANGFDFQANYIVQNYEVTGKVKGKVAIAAGNGSNFSPDALNIVRNVEVNSKLYVEIKVKGPDGKITTSICSIKVLK
ncbi:MAG: hypothetical protein IT236_17680 [Bacteroidia bacterium]|nr:hypothetical protein [Bacteroidia bacterium]